jgi:hypothetical protein
LLLKPISAYKVDAMEKFQRQTSDFVAIFHTMYISAQQAKFAMKPKLESCCLQQWRDEPHQVGILYSNA